MPLLRLFFGFCTRPVDDFGFPSGVDDVEVETVLDGIDEALVKIMPSSDDESDDVSE